MWAMADTRSITTCPAQRPRPQRVRHRASRRDADVTLEEVMTGTKRLLDIDGRRLEVNIPAGVADGQRIRFSKVAVRQRRIHQGQGPAAPVFTRDGANLTRELPLTLREALLGGEVPVKTLTGRVMLRIPPETQNGRTFRLTGQGLPRFRKDGRGDLYARVRVVLPTWPVGRGQAGTQKNSWIWSTSQNHAKLEQTDKDCPRQHEARPIHREGAGGDPRRPAPRNGSGQPRPRRGAHPCRAARGRRRRPGRDPAPARRGPGAGQRRAGGRAEQARAHRRRPDVARSARAPAARACRGRGKAPRRRVRLHGAPAASRLPKSGGDAQRILEARRRRTRSRSWPRSRRCAAASA